MSLDRQPPSNHAQDNSGLAASLDRLPVELYPLLFAALDLPDLCSLSLVSNSIRRAVEDYGWSAWLNQYDGEARRWQILPRKETFPPTTGRELAKRTHQINHRWKRKTFVTRSVILAHLARSARPVNNGSGNSAATVKKANASSDRRHSRYLDRAKDNLAMPILELTPQGLLLAARSYLYWWPAELLQNLSGIYSRDPKVTSLYAGDGQPTAWEDVSQMALIDRNHLAIGRVDGRLEIWSLPTVRARSKHGKGSTAPSPLPRLVLTLEPPDEISSAMGSVQAMSYLPARKQLAVGWKRGLVAVYQCTYDDSLGLRLIRQWDVGSRLWSVHLGLSSDDGEPWLAVGCQAEIFLRLYRSVPEGDPVEQGPLLKAVSDSEPAFIPLILPGRAKTATLAPYALASSRSLAGNTSRPPFPRSFLFAGLYNGSLLVFDVASTGSDRLEPVRTFRDRFDPSPIYSVTLGIGPRSSCIAVGTARHGIVKVYDMEHSGETDSWSMYPPWPPTDSPVYGIAGEHGRLFCASSNCLWECDMRRSLGREKPSLDVPPDERLVRYCQFGEGQNPQDGEDALSVGYYYHGDTMRLQHTGADPA